jgi:hypothetical protein
MRKGSHLSAEQLARQKERCSDPIYRAKQSAAHMGHAVSDETKKKIRIARSKQVGEKHPRYGKHHTPETRAKLSITHKGKQMGEQNPFYGKKHSPETIKKFSEMRKGKQTGKNHPRYGKPAPHGRISWFVLPDGQRMMFRSSYEIRVAIALSDMHVSFQYEPKAFSLDDMGTLYWPDFYLPEYGVWWEVKGWMRPDAKRKLERFFQLYPNENLVIIRELDIIKLESGSVDMFSLGNRIID